MKVTTLVLVAALPTATVVWSDLFDPAASTNAWVHPQYAYDYLKQCEESGTDREVCACTAKHILIETPGEALPAVSAGPPGSRDATRAVYQGYQESCERWADVLGLLEADDATTGADG